MRCPRLLCALAAVGPLNCGTSTPGGSGSHPTVGNASNVATSTVSPSAAPAPSSDASSGGDVCDGLVFTVTKNEVSAQMPTVGVVEWGLSGGTARSANVVYTLQGASNTTLNAGGEAPVDLERPNLRTLLLGLKQGRDYTFQIEAVIDTKADGDSLICRSNDYALPTTGVLVGPPSINVVVDTPERRDPGFIVASSGQPEPNRGYIVDADGDVVWSVEGPEDTSRAKMDYEGNGMWMLALNLNNQVGEMRFVSMDGQDQQHDVPGLERAHHDFTVLPGGRVGAIAWLGVTPFEESTLIIRSPDGTIDNPFDIGGNLYNSLSFHANAIHYLPFDGGFTISDRTPNLLVKVSATGKPEWQLGGECMSPPTGTRCSPQTWEVNHGHHLLEDGTFVVFNNTYTEASHVLEFQLNASDTAFSATLVTDYTGDHMTATLGDVQRLPSGNTLVTYSSDSKVVELDPSWNVVQTFSGPFAYADWRPTLYGPPPRP